MSNGSKGETARRRAPPRDRVRGSGHSTSDAPSIATSSIGCLLLFVADEVSAVARCLRNCQPAQGRATTTPVISERSWSFADASLVSNARGGTDEVLVRPRSDSGFFAACGSKVNANIQTASRTGICSGFFRAPGLETGNAVGVLPGNGVRRKKKSTPRAPSNNVRSHSTCAPPCPSRGAATSFGNAETNSSK